MRSFDGTLSTYVLEDVAGGEGLSAHYRERSGKHLAAHEIFARAGAGESLADEIVKQGASSLGMALGHAVGMLDPPAIIMGGGLASSGFYMKHIEDEMRRFIWHEASRGVPVLRASLGGEACLWGAALAAERTMS
jgi:glucokinase